MRRCTRRRPAFMHPRCTLCSPAAAQPPCRPGHVPSLTHTCLPRCPAPTPPRLSRPTPGAAPCSLPDLHLALVLSTGPAHVSHVSAHAMSKRALDHRHISGTHSAPLAPSLPAPVRRLPLTPLPFPPCPIARAAADDDEESEVKRPTALTEEQRRFVNLGQRRLPPPPRPCGSPIPPRFR